jgi:MFS transporter, DHA1 family, tetracycline resistance protein
VAISYLGYAMMGTLFVPMLLSPTSTYVASDTSRAVRSLLIGVLLMLYPLAQVVGSPILGALSDRLGRRPILLASLVVTTAAYALIVLALAVQSLWLLGVALVICGFGEANAAITSSVVADVTDPEVRPKYLGYMFSVMSVSYVLGPLVGGALAASFGYVVPFGVVLVLLGLALVAVRWRFAETHQPDPASEPVPLSASFGNLKTVFTDRLLRRIYLINFLVFVAAMGFWRVITEYLVDVFHLTVGEVTMDYSVFAVTAGIGNLLILPRLLPHFGLRPLRPRVSPSARWLWSQRCFLDRNGYHWRLVGSAAWHWLWPFPRWAACCPASSEPTVKGLSWEITRHLPSWVRLSACSADQRSLV